ncbi:MAG: hypothetical protein EOP45_04855 [Sphingobacteriaceae bacterium]|nr:MAG: hypothetical protein EOP45_04855 [Sphingobacteriaceae bacterium]
MKQIFGLLLLVFMVACGDKTQTTNITSVDTSKQVNTMASSPYGFDTSFEISKRHKPFILIGYFNQDKILDTAILIKQKKNRKDALFIKHGGTHEFFLLKDGKDLKTNFNDFNWVGQFEIIKKGTKIWNNVIDGEIIGEDQVPNNRKIILQTDGILVHEDEGGGGGIIYFKKGRYIWVQQD